MQEEQCQENFSKTCFIQYSQTASQATVQVCVEPLVKDCGAEGEEVCSKEYQAECERVSEPSIEDSNF